MWRNKIHTELSKFASLRFPVILKTKSVFFFAEIKYDLSFNIVLVFLLPDLLLSRINLLRRLSQNHRKQYTHLTPYDNFRHLCNNMYASPAYCVFAHEVNCLLITCWHMDIAGPGWSRFFKRFGYHLITVDYHCVYISTMIVIAISSPIQLVFKICDDVCVLSKILMYL